MIEIRLHGARDYATHTHVNALLSDAVDDGILLANPAQGITRRGRKGPDTITQAERQRKIRPMTVNQLEMFLACARAQGSRREWTLFMTLADAGLRPGEALALRWEDFDEVGRALNVERAVSDREVKPTKSEARRRVDLTPRLTEALAQWQSAGELAALTAGTEPSPWMFPTSTGTLIEVVAVGKRFRLVLRKAGLPGFRLYDLRHTYATHLLAEGAPITYVAAQLGHAKATTTRRTTRTGSRRTTRAGSSVSPLVARRNRKSLAPKLAPNRGRGPRVFRNCLNWLEPGARVELATLITNPGPEPTQQDQEKPTEQTGEPST